MRIVPAVESVLKEVDWKDTRTMLTNCPEYLTQGLFGVCSVQPYDGP